jgi:DNA-binding beta-propeller fold protein YncE
VATAQGFPWNRHDLGGIPSNSWDDGRVDTESLPASHSSRGFRIVIIAASVIAAIVGSVLLATRDSGEKATTLGVTATLQVPGHPGAVTAGPDAVWVALNGDSRKPVGDRPLLLLDLATGAVAQTVYLGGQAFHLAHDLRRADGAPLSEDRLIASVQHVGSDGFGPTELVVLEWRSGVVLLRRGFEGPVDQLVLDGSVLWALEGRPGTLLRLDPGTLAPTSAPLGLSPGRTLGLASGGGYVWVTAADAGEVLRIDPVTYAIKRVQVGGFPIGIVVTGGRVWYADRDGGKVVRLDPRTLRPVGESIRVGAKPSWLAVAGGSLFVTDEDDGTVARIDVHSGETVGLPIRIARPARNGPAPAMAPVGRSVWVSSFVSNTLTRINSRAGNDDRGGKVTVRIAGTNDGGDRVTDGGVAGTGRFTASGAIRDKGKVTGYRTVKGAFITLRFVSVGTKGTITFVVKIDTNVGTSRWTITSGTRAYKGLHGRGIERENADYTVSTLTGTVWR